MRRTIDNRGNALSLVIIIIAFASILVAAVLSVATLNIQMKSVDRRTKENFYSAEGALEQINLGLQEAMTEAASEAYSVIMQNYASIPSEEARRLRFNQEYVLSLQGIVGLAGVGGNYDRAKLESYLSDDIRSFAGVNANGEACEMQAEADSVVLKDVVVSFEDAEGYLTYIETDIRLTAPNLNLVHPLEMPDVFEYSIIANQKLEAAGTGTATFGANVYAGEDGMILGAGSHWIFDGAKRLIVSGNVDIPKTGTLTISDELDLWANEILVKGGNLSTNGRTYVANDLILSGEESNVALNGEYYGYGNGAGLTAETTPGNSIVLVEPGEESAILINGTKTKLDMSGVRRLYLGGSAQIRGEDIGGPTNRNADKNINFGESVEVKSNQIAYLVPPECIGVYNGEALIGRNPMTIEEYNKFDDYEAALGDDFERVSFTTVVEGLGKTLAEYKPDEGTGYQEIFLTVNGSQMVYFYVDFDTDQTSRYFRDYYAANEDTLDKFMKNYVDKITLRDNNVYVRRYTDGNLIYSAGDGMPAVLSNEGYGAFLSDDDRNAYRQESEEYKSRFKAFGTKLIPDYEDLSADERGKTVFDNIIDYDSGKFAGLHSDGEIYYAEGDNNTQAVVINNSGGLAYHYNDVKDSQSKICLIIATGDVVLEKDFTGVVIARGIVTVNGNVSVNTDMDRLRKILKTKVSVDAEGLPITFIEHYFRDGEKYVLDEGVGDESIVENEYINFGDLITYEDWTKR